MTNFGHYLFPLLLAFSAVLGLSQSSDAQRLLDAARLGEMQAVDVLLGRGVSPNVADVDGNTPLHLAASGGHQATAEFLINKGATINSTNHLVMTPLDVARSRGHSGMAAFLVERGAVCSSQPPTAATAVDGKRGFHPDAPFITAGAFARAIGRPAIMLDSTNVSILAPKSREQAAAIVLPYLARAYEELYRIVGVHTKYRLLVYAYPKGTPGVRGGTSGCVIKYTDENLDLSVQQEWTQHHVPRVSGYIEEMAHHFVHATGAEFGWEMIGWSLSVKVCEMVAPNPIWHQQVADTRRNQDLTWQRYIASQQTFPADLPGDQVDRLHAYLLRKCELQYGPKFWTGFFAEVRNARSALSAAEAQGERGGMDLRYRLTVECFNRLPGLNFKNLLEQSGISTTAAIQSLKPTDSAWNRKLR